MMTATTAAETTTTTTTNNQAYSVILIPQDKIFCGVINVKEVSTPVIIQ
jgi:hypothetical protein